MKKFNKKKITARAAILAVVGTIMFGSGVAFAATALLNWNGTDDMTKAGIYIDQVTNKVIKLEGEKDTVSSSNKELQKENEQLGKDKVNLEKEITKLEKEIEKLRQEVASKDEGWTQKDQQIVELNNRIIELNNQLILKENDIEHLTRELQRANEAAQTVGSKVDAAYDKLNEAGINIWN